jgi:hypothetical protein
MTHSEFWSVTVPLLIILFLGGANDEGEPPEPSKASLIFDHAVGLLQTSTWQARYEQIKKELEKDRKEPWEGMYHDSLFIGLGLRPMISRKSGFVSTGKNPELGKVEVAEDREAGEYKVMLVSDLPLRQSGAKTYVYFMIRWGERVYLVNPKDMLEFCNAVNSGRLRKTWQSACPFLLRQEDYEKEATGLPVVPKQYAEYILPKPIRAVLVRHDRFKERVAVAGETALHNGLVVTLNVGYEDGVRTGMNFYAQGLPDESRCYRGYVIAVGKHESDLLLAVPWLWNDGLKTDPKDYPKGTKFSTINMDK